MTPEQALAIIALLLQRTPMNTAEVYAVNEAIKALTPPPKPAS